jgi:hypothetical protein
LLEEEAHLYVERPEDREIAADIRRGNYVALIGARQMGKTSLLLKLRRQLLEEGHIPIYLDLSPVRDREKGAWYRYLQGVMEGQLEWSDADVPVPPMQDHVGFRAALRDMSRHLASSRKVVVLLDEVSALPSSVSDLFFSTIRTVFNEREVFPWFRRYVFVMAGTFIPDRLVTDPTISPFNIASRRYASDASQEKLAGLVRNLDQAGFSASDEVVGRIYGWTDGHLYLTQRLCATLERSTDGQLTTQHVDAAVDGILGDRNIEHIYRDLSQMPDVKECLERILAGERPLRFNRTSTLIAELELIGVIKPGSDGCCRIRNAIYRRALADRYEGLSPDDVGELTRLEHRLHVYFCDNVGRTCTKYEIAEAIWGKGSYSERSIEDRIYRLVARVRDKLDTDPANTLQILTVRGRGYKPQRRE